MMLICLTACITVKAEDSIDKVISGFDSNGLWMNGIFSPISLPETAKPEEVIQAALLEYRKKDLPCVTLEIKKVKIESIGSRIEYMAARVKIQSTERVVLFRYEGEKIGWWSRTY